MSSCLVYDLTFICCEFSGHINNQYNTCFWMLVKSGKSNMEAQTILKVLFSSFLHFQPRNSALSLFHVFLWNQIGATSCNALFYLQRLAVNK